ncbi:MAG: hypothetical protein VW547_12210, partial [Alphaproteobacteria bacterium]
KRLGGSGAAVAKILRPGHFELPEHLDLRFHTVVLTTDTAWGLHGKGAAGSGAECTPCFSHGITPLQNTKSAALAVIAALTSPTGTTNITQWFSWAWRVVNPEAPFTETDPDPNGPRQQAIVLLTDGENFAGNGDGYKTLFGYGRGGRAEINNRLRELFANVKASSVKTYAIQFATRAALCRP